VNNQPAEVTKQELPERVYLHPASAEWHPSRWPLEPEEYIEYTRAAATPTEQARIRAALLQAARDVCCYCGGRATAFFSSVNGPNEARNFTHQRRADKDAQALCIASAIYMRMHYAPLPPAPKE
jgi:hypothetical protein